MVDFGRQHHIVFVNYSLFITTSSYSPLIAYSNKQTVCDSFARAHVPYTINDLKTIKSVYMYHLV